jgi:replicative DNA helicase
MVVATETAYKAPPFRELIIGKNGQATLRVHMHTAQAKVWNSQARFVAYIAGAQSGKALAVDTPIPTPSGFKLMQDLRVGDIVYNSLGQETRVTYVSPVYLGNECYRLTFDDGVEVVADAGHQWVTQNYHQRKNQDRRCVSNPEWVANRPQCQATADDSILTTAQIAVTVKGRKCRSGRYASNHAIGIAPPFIGVEREVPVPPYVLGVWLGDGNTSSAHITSADPQI